MNCHFKTILALSSMLAINNLYSDNGLPNLSPRLATQPKTVEIFADCIYWYTSETVDWSFTLKQNSAFESSFKTFAFDWAPGLRIGLGYNMLHDQWNSQLSYTWFQSKASGHTSGEVTPSFFAARLSALEPFSTGKASIHLHYNTLDWDCGRLFFVSKYLLMRPSIGLKGAWIDQHIFSHWTKPSVFVFIARENLKQRFLGVGPKGGITTKWCFGNIQRHSFSLMGRLEAGYLWGHWVIWDQYIDDFLTKISVNTSPRNFTAFMLHSFFGIGWDTNFDRNRSHFGLKFGYEIEDWLNYCQIFTDDSGSQNNDLIMQGLNLGLSFDF